MGASSGSLGSLALFVAAAMTAACAPSPAPQPVLTGRSIAAVAPAQAPAQRAKHKPRSEKDAIGGDSSVEIEAPAYAIMDLLVRPEAAWRVLPHVSFVEDLGVDQGDLVWRVEHKFSFVRGGYVVRLRKDWDDHGRHLVRFWIDKRFDRDIDDAWGYFVLEPMGPNRTRLRYHVRAVLLPGIIKWFFSEKVQWALMITPTRAVNYINKQRKQRDKGH